MSRNAVSDKIAAMLRDARSVTDQSVLQTDLCILGAGAAGITLAREFAGTPHDVLLLESGGFDFDEKTQSLYDGESDGTVLVPSNPYLRRSRLRYFGGSTNHWEGFCRPLDLIDFRAREWVPHSGWPIGFSELVPYYRRAAELCQLEGLAIPEPETNPADRAPLLLEGVEGVLHERFHLSPPTRFGAAYRQEVVHSSNVTVCLFANAVELTTNHDASRVESVEVKSLKQNAFKVVAKYFVLACGGIENPRLLLASNSVEPKGLGNRHDLVGRFFMEHPHLVAGALAYVPPSSAPPRSLDSLMGDSPRTTGLLRLSDASQETHRLLNCSIQPLTITRARNVGSFMKGVASMVSRIESGSGPDETRPLFAHLLVRAEQSPHPDSRVRLGAETDPFGKPRARLEWRLNDLDRTTIRRSLDLVGRRIGEAGRGRVRIVPVLERGWPPTQGGSHHMGTTRMHSDPKHGVVDANGRVHSVSNLFIAGSSNFPTSGSANPTLTLVALSFRLAENLKTHLGAQ
jgi:choline dehydrogenase-like flavoprotein